MNFVPVSILSVIFTVSAIRGAFTLKTPPIKIRAGILLTENSSLMFDLDYVRPALEVAFDRVLIEYNVEFEPIWIPYNAHCSRADAVGYAAQLTLVDKVDVIVGPGCSEDMVMVAEFTTFYPMPVLTGAGELFDTMFMYPYLVRFSFNTYSMWRIFIKMMQFYHWLNVVLIQDSRYFPKNVTTRGLMNILADENMEPYEIRLKTKSLDAGATNSTRDIISYLKEGSTYGRIFVLSMESLLLRRFMIEAKKLSYCDGDYAFFALDLYEDDVTGIGRKGWQQNDTDDGDAKKAYGSLFLLTLMDKRSLPTYRKFEQDVYMRSEKYYTGKHVDINYHTAAFHDSIIMFAINANRTVEEGRKIDKDAIVPLTQRFWGTSFEGGASGRVYIDPFGDRSDDHTLLHLESEESGVFQVVANYYGYKMEYEEIANISWPGRSKKAPLNRPKCGFLGDDPICAEIKQPITEITIGVAFALMTILGVVVLLIYRKIKAESALSSLDWIASWSEILYMYSRTTDTRTNFTDKNRMNFADVSFRQNGHTQIEKEISMHSSIPLHGSKLANFRGNVVLVHLCEKHKIELNKELLLEARDARTANHENLLRFVGAILGPDSTAVITELCTKGNLQNLLLNNVIKLDDLFKNSLLHDIIKAMVFIHQSVFEVHGRLTSLCCWIDGRFVLKVGDYGLPTFYAKSAPLKPDNEYFSLMLWKAPEELQYNSGPTQEGDVYSFGVILQEVLLREEPFSMFQLSAEEIVRRVVQERSPPFRPKVEDSAGPMEIVQLMRKCWCDIPDERPKFLDIRQTMRDVIKSEGQQGNIMDTLLSRMESYAQNLESIVEEKTQAFLEEKRKSDQLLNQVLPRSVAEQLKKGEPVHPEAFESVTIYFSDIVGFTTISSESSPMQIVDLLNDLYTCFDTIITRYDVYKVETIGDSYMCVSGLPIRNGLVHAVHIARMALNLLSEVKLFKIRHRPDEQLKLRIGMHSGPCVSGVVGLTMPRYCLFGDTVNVASRMESTGEELKIQISGTTQGILEGFRSFEMVERGEISVKGKGQLKTYWLLREI